MVPSFLQNLDIKTIIFLGILFGVLGFFLWNKYKPSSAPKQQPQQQVIEEPVADQPDAPKVLSV